MYSCEKPFTDCHIIECIQGWTEEEEKLSDCPDINDEDNVFNVELKQMRFDSPSVAQDLDY